MTNLKAAGKNTCGLFYFQILLPGSLMPSIGNRWVFGKKRCYLDSKTQARLDAVKEIFKKAIKNYTCNFAFVLALLTDRKRRFDAHNYTKTLGDVLQKVGLVVDDTCLEICCMKFRYFSETAMNDLVLIFPFETVEEFSNFLQRKVFSRFLKSFV